MSRIPLNLFAVIPLSLFLAVLVGCQPKPSTAPPTPTFMQTEREFREKAAELRMSRGKIEAAIKRLELKQQESLDFLKEKGVKSLADVGEDPDQKFAVRNLKGWSDEIAARKADISHYDNAIRGIEAMLSELERKRIGESVAVSEEDYTELKVIEKDLNERLGMDRKDILKDEELDNLLKETLGEPQQATSSDK